MADNNEFPPLIDSDDMKNIMDLDDNVSDIFVSAIQVVLRIGMFNFYLDISSTHIPILYNEKVYLSKLNI
jgi:hypothetical protein